VAERSVGVMTPAAYLGCGNFIVSCSSLILQVR